MAISRQSKLVGIQAYEALAYFSAKGKLVRLDSWLYNRGEQGQIAFERFENINTKISVQLNNIFIDKNSKLTNLVGQISLKKNEVIFLIA